MAVPAAASQRAPNLLPPAAQPNLIRALQKDELYLQHLTDGCHDAVRRLLGPHRALRWADETRALAQLLYFGLTTGSRLQTLGEEYCDIVQVASMPAALPSTARRGLLVLMQALGPYLADRLAVPQDDGWAAWQQAQAAASAGAAATADRQDRKGPSLLQRMTAVLRSLQEEAQRAVQPVSERIPAAATLFREHGSLLMRLHLALFYVFGLYYQPFKRLAGVRYLFLGRAFQDRPSYRFLGVLLFSQLGVSGLLWLARRYGGLSPALWGHGALQAASGRATHAILLAVDEKPLLHAVDKGNQLAGGGTSVDGEDMPNSRKCPLCLSARTVPTATPCGHVFCWQCITDWCNQKPECPLCRADFAASQLVCVRHANF